MKRHHSIKTSILMTIMIVAGLVAVTLTAYSFIKSSQLVKASNREIIQTASSEISIMVEGYLNSHKGYLSGQEKALNFINRYDADTLSEFTANMVDAYPEALYVYFNTMTDEGHFTSSDGWIPPEDYTWQDRDWIQPVAASEVIFIDEPSYDSVTEHVVTVLRKRVFDSNIRGILNMAISLEKLSVFLMEAELPSDSYAMLIDDNGRIVAYPDTSIFVGNSDVPVITTLIPDFEYDKDSLTIDHMVYISEPVSGTEWKVWVAVPKDYFSYGINPLLWNNAIIFLTVLSFGILLAAAVSKRITAPLLSLKAFALSVASNNQELKMDNSLLSVKNEVGEFAGTFNQMYLSLQDRTEELIKSKDEIQNNFEEMQALYEEMAAAEETLQSNYHELDAYKNRVEKLAYYSEITGLANQKALFEKLNNLLFMESADRFILLYVGIKEYDHYMEILSRRYMEKLHQDFALRIRNRLVDIRETGLYDIRLGHFAVLVQMGQYEKVVSILEEIAQVLKSGHSNEEATVWITLGIGGVKLSEIKLPAIDSYLLNDFGEQALREALKGSSRETIRWYDSAMASENALNAFIESELKKAVDEHAFSIVIQPKYDWNNSIIGGEALVRWTHPTHGLISPLSFIDIAESLGIIDKIDEQVLLQVIALIKRLKKNNHSMKISVNMSIYELMDREYLEKVDQHIIKSGIRLSDICFEITETAFSANLDIIIDNLQWMSHRGYEFHLDDFGSGDSSLSYLTAFPISQIKLDRSFVNRLMVDPKVMEVVGTVFDLAQRLNMGFVAEGVETESQLQVLRDLGCRQYQGFLFNKPLSIEDFINEINKSVSI